MVASGNMNTCWTSLVLRLYPWNDGNVFGISCQGYVTCTALYQVILSVVTVEVVFVKGSFRCISLCGGSYCRYTCWMLLSNQILELE